MSDACVYLMKNINFKDTYEPFETEIKNTHINIGTGVDISIKELAIKIKRIIGFKGQFIFNTEKPDGTFRKVTNVSKIHNLGWKHSVDLDQGLAKLYTWYLKKVDE